MPAILFLHGASNRLQAAATWLENRNVPSGRTVVFDPDPAKLAMLDRLLWTASGTGFTPHCLADNALAGETPILLTSSLTAVPPAPCLLNLGDELPPGIERFDEVVEIISTDDDVRLPGRERFRYYRNSGFAIDSIDIAGGIPG